MRAVLIRFVKIVIEIVFTDNFVPNVNQKARKRNGATFIANLGVDGKRDERVFMSMKVGQHYYSTISKIRTRAFGALTGV